MPRYQIACSRSRFRRWLGTLFVAVPLLCQTQSQRDIAKAIDKNILKLHDLNDGSRKQAILNLAAQISRQPPQYARPLAFNLAVDGIEGSDRETQQTITSSLVDGLRSLPPGDTSNSDCFEMLAELVLYEHTHPALTDPRLRAAVEKLQVADRVRNAANFSLTDLDGNNWTLKALSGKVVLVNFWATWCPPCQREITDLNAICQRFQGREFVLLAISDEAESVQRRFAAKHPMSYSLLIDPQREITQRFLVNSIPKTFVYNRQGLLVAQSIDRPSQQGFLDMLASAGLH